MLFPFLPSPLREGTKGERKTLHFFAELQGTKNKSQISAGCQSAQA
jgi:hypothetical protein